MIIKFSLSYILVTLYSLQILIAQIHKVDPTLDSSERYNDNYSSAPSQYEIDSLFKALVAQDSLSFYSIDNEMNDVDEILEYLEFPSEIETSNFIKPLQLKSPKPLLLKSYRIKHIDTTKLKMLYPELEEYPYRLEPKTVEFLVEKNLLKFHYKGELDPFEISIFDIHENMAYYKFDKDFNGEFSQNIDMTTWGSGQYLLRIVQKNSVYYKTIQVRTFKL